MIKIIVYACLMVFVVGMGLYSFFVKSAVGYAIAWLVMFLWLQDRFFLTVLKKRRKRYRGEG